MKELELQYKALANRRRLEILRLLKRTGRLSVGSVADKIGLSYRSTSKHLGILARVNAVAREQIGLTVYCSLPGKPPLPIKQALERL